MRRSVRNGLAIAAMAGGLWFLGNAVANASTQDASAANNVDQSSSSQGGGAVNGNVSGASAENVNVTSVSTSVQGGKGGNNEAYVNTGAITDGGSAPFTASTMNDPKPPPPPPAPSVTITTGDATVNQQANGGSVSGSGNVQITPSPVNQTASAVNNVQQSATSTSSNKEHHDGRNDGPKSMDMMGPDGHGGFAGNFNFSFANAKNVNVTRVDSYVAGGKGGNNYADVNTGLIGYAPEIHKGTYNITTGSATVNQQANGGSVSNSGNVNIGPAGQGPCACTPAQQQEKKKAAAAPCPAKAAPKAVVPAAKVSPVVLSSAQPTGVLATTGAEYGAPLILGLMALGAGAGLTVAGRRRTSANV